jgi:hypothetical protein
MREIRTSSSMRGRRKRAIAQRACALLYLGPCLVIVRSLDEDTFGSARFAQRDGLVAEAKSRILYKNGAWASSRHTGGSSERIGLERAVATIIEAAGRH